MKKIFSLSFVIMLSLILVGCDIENSKKDAEKNTRAIVKSAKNYYAEALNKGEILDNPLTLKASELNVDNSPSSGTVTISYSILEDIITVTADDLIFDKYICNYKNKKAFCIQK